MPSLFEHQINQNII